MLLNETFPSYKEAQAKISTLLSSSTFIIGHSLHHSFRHLRIAHQRIIGWRKIRDDVVMFLFLLLLL